MLKAIKFEMIKLFTGRKLYVIAAVIVGITVFMGFGVKVMNEIEDISNKIFVNGQSFPIFLLEQFVDLLAILLVILLGGLISDEYRDGTLKLVLLRPVKRCELIASKIVVVITSVVTYLTVALLSGYFAGTLIFGWGDGLIIPRTEIAYSTTEGIFKTLIAYDITVFPLVAFLLIVLLFSIVIDNSGIVLGTGLGIFFLFQLLTRVVGNARIFIINNHLIIGRLIVQSPSDVDFVKSFVVIALYLGALGAICFVLFRKKDIVF